MAKPLPSAQPRAGWGRRRGALVEEMMRAWLRSVVDVILGRVPSKASRLDTATRMMIDADFSSRREPGPAAPPRKPERDDGHLVKPIAASADAALFEQLIRVVNE